MNKKIYNEDLTLNLILNGDKLQPGNKKLLQELYKLDDATRQLQLRNAALELEKRKLNKTSANYASELKRIEREMRANNQTIDGYHARMMDLRKQIGITGLTINQLNTHLKILQTMLRNATSPETIKQLQREISEVKVRIDMLTTGASRLSIAWSNMARTINKYSAAVGWLSIIIFSVSNAIGNMIGRVADLDRTLSNVMKTTGLTRAEMYRLKHEFDVAPTPTKTDDLLKMAEISGKLGIEGYEKIKKFSMALDILNVALKSDLNMSVEEVANHVGKLVNAFRVTDKLPIDEAILRTGSLLNELDKSSVASAGTILNYMTRLSSLGTTANYPMEKLAGLAAAMETVNIPAERGSTALRNIINGLGKYSEKFARILGWDLATYTKAVETDINSVFLKLIELTSKGDKSIIDMTASMGDFQISGVRVQEVYSALAQHLDVVREQQDIATEAFKSSASVMSEFNIISKDFQGNIDLQKKRVTALADEYNVKLAPAGYKLFKLWVDFLYVLKDLANSLYIHQNILKSLPFFYAAWKATAIVGWVKSLAFTIQYYTWELYNNIKATIANNTALLALRRHGMAGLLDMIRQLWAALLANPFGPILAVISAAMGAFYLLAGKIDLVREALMDLQKEMLQQTRNLKAVFDAAINSAIGTDKHRAAINAINEQYGKYLPKLLTEADSIDTVTKARNQAITALRQEIALKWENERLSKLQEDFLDQRKNAADRLLGGLEPGKLGAAAYGLDELTQKIMDIKSTYDDLTAGNMGKNFLDQFGMSNQASRDAMRVYIEMLLAEKRQLENLKTFSDAYKNAGANAKKKQSGDGLPGTNTPAPMTEEDYKSNKVGIERANKEQIIALNNSKKNEDAFKADSLKQQLAYTNEMIKLEEAYAAADTTALEELRVSKSNILREIYLNSVKLKENEKKDDEKYIKEKAIIIKDQIEEESDRFDRMIAVQKLAFTRGEMDEQTYNNQILGLELEKWMSIQKIQEQGGIDSSETQQKVADAELAIRKNNIKISESAAEQWYADEKLRIEEQFGGEIEQKASYDRQLLLAEVAYQTALLGIKQAAGENTVDIELKLFNLRKELMNASIKDATIAEKELSRVYDKKSGFLAKYMALSKQISKETIDSTKSDAEKKASIGVLTKAQEELTQAEAVRLATTISADIDSANSAQEATVAIINSIRNRIQAYIAEAIAKAVAKEAGKGLLGIITATAAAAAFTLLFNALIPKFSINSTTGKTEAKTMQFYSGKYPVKGKDDGKTYMAQWAGQAQTGIYGSPALIAEQGPEMVVDYPTLRNMQMNAPGLIQAIMAMRVPQYAGGRYGGVGPVGQGGPVGSAMISYPGSGDQGESERWRASIDELNRTLKNGITAKVAGYGGEGSVASELKKMAALAKSLKL